MLVLSCKVGESIIIDDNIELTVIACEGNVVKLGIQAPKDISIHRKEIYLEIQEENKAAIEIDVDMNDFKKFKK